MKFNSLEFLFFFSTVSFVYYLLSDPSRRYWLLAASCFFYMFFIPAYILILLITILIDYFAAIWMEKSEGKRKKFFLWGSVFSTCVVLFFFKYYNFFIGTLNGFSGFFSINASLPFWNIILPVGLSFHTFQSLSYVIEVYRGQQKVEHHFPTYALYVMFFPQLVAGPIERPQNLLVQISKKHEFDYDRASEGLKLMAWGFFKKLVIADRLGLYVEAVYQTSDMHNGWSLMLATVFFGFQIYCDFSAYSDIARGTSKILGYELMVNFKHPYLSRSLGEFWRRWHISLSTWFRDYVYIPLGGNRQGNVLWIRNIFIVFFISGFWHGADWKFVAWGLSHGLFLIGGYLTLSYRDWLWQRLGILKSLRPMVSLVITFVLVNICWVFFRAKSFADAWMILGKIFHPRGELYMGYNGSHAQFYLVCSWIVFLMATEIGAEYNIRFLQLFSSDKSVLRYCSCLALIFIIILFGVLDGGQFIYFQF